MRYLQNCIEPRLPWIGIVAVTYVEKLKYDDRVDLSTRILMTPSLILVWGFSDPIHPQVPNKIYITTMDCSCSLN